MKPRCLNELRVLRRASELRRSRGRVHVALRFTLNMSERQRASEPSRRRELVHVPLEFT